MPAPLALAIRIAAYVAVGVAIVPPLLRFFDPDTFDKDRFILGFLALIWPVVLFVAIPLMLASQAVGHVAAWIWGRRG